MTATTRTDGLGLRPVTEADREFLIEVYGSTRHDELSRVPWQPGQREAFVRMQFAAQDTWYRQQSPRGSFDLITLDGRPAGRLYVDRGPDEIRIIDITLLTELRGAGIGSRLIRSLQQEARASDRLVSLHVEVDNRAALLYERLGFVTVAESGLHRRMEWGL